MKPSKTLVVAAMALTITACNIMKKSKTTATPSAPSVATTPATKSKDGVFAPGNDELDAIRANYKDVTMKTLADGYAIYTGVCTNCHGTMNIYSRPEAAWPAIIDDMAQKAKITDAQKDAVCKYVLAVKATQHKKTF